MLGHLGTVVYNDVFCSSLWSGRLVDCLRCTGGLQHHCATLWAMSTLKNEGLHRGLLSLRGPLRRPASLAGRRSSCLSGCVERILQNGQRSSLTVFFSFLCLLFPLHFPVVLPSACPKNFPLSVMHAGATHAFELCGTVFLLDEASARCGYPSVVMRLLLQMLWLGGAPSAECWV